MSSDTQPPVVHDDTDKADTAGGGGANQQPTPPVTSDTLKAGDAISDELLARLAKLEKYEHKLAEVARVYRNLNGARKSIEVVLKKLTPVQSIADVDELEEYLSNLSMKAQYAGEQIGALTEQDKTNRGKITELERQVSRLSTADDERQRAVRDLETSLRERKVSEGQLERANQKLRLDIGSLEAKLAERDGEKEASQALTVDAADADSLASRLTELISSDSDGGTLGEESMAALRKTIIGRWGPPEGFVSAGELETSARALESCQQEVVQVKDIMRKELDASEERIKQVSEEKDGRIRELAQQLESATSAAATAANASAGGSGSDNGGLSAERVTSVINAAVAGKLAGSSKPVATNSASDTPPLPTATAAVGAAGKKKGNKKKRRGTQSITPSQSPSPSPASEAAKATSADDDAADNSMVEVTRSEIARLVELIESAGNREGNSDSGSGSGSGNKATELLETQLAEARKAAEEAQREIKEENSKVDQLRADVAQLEARIGEAETLRDKLREEKEVSEKERARVEGQLDKQAKQIKELEEQLDKKATRIKSLEKQLATTNKELSECRAKLGAAEEAASGHNEERTQLAQSLAKTQGANARLEARQRELQTQADKMTSEREEQRKRVSSMQETLAKLEEEHAKTLAT
ncbi:hypothetical protein GGH99_003243, partial [Coemansia sp. RSA 1285]